MRAMARSAVAVGLAILALVLAATMLSVMFATRGAMSTNRQIIEVLHVVGAKEGFHRGRIPAPFPAARPEGRRDRRRRRDGAVRARRRSLSDWFKGSPGETQAGALFGNLSLGPEGYGAMIGLVVLVAAVTAGTSRLTVHRTLRSME